MIEKDQETKTEVHPLQPKLNGCMLLAGILGAIALMILTAFSFYLIVNSAEAIGQPVDIITSIILLIMIISVLIIFYLNKKSGITYLVQNTSHTLDNFLILNVLLLLLGFIQTFFWVIDYDENMHEPRSVFILAVAGSFAYMRQQYLKYSTVADALGTDSEGGGA
ncbi:MAG: hypothetical protein KC708_15050 [Anaerolineae bacterium]|nr:hypothetical protein [Anaerolineae bacterium]